MARSITLPSRRTADDATWPERYALGVFVVITPLSLMLSASEADAVNTILVVNTAAALAAWGLFRTVARRFARR